MDLSVAPASVNASRLSDAARLQRLEESLNRVIASISHSPSRPTQPEAFSQSLAFDAALERVRQLVQSSDHLLMTTETTAQSVSAIGTNLPALVAEARSTVHMAHGRPASGMRRASSFTKPKEIKPKTAGASPSMAKGSTELSQEEGMLLS